jgi:hypothetical protein
MRTATRLPVVAPHLGAPLGGSGVPVPAAAVPLDAPGLTTTTAADDRFAAGLIEQLRWHRHWSRPVVVAGSQVVRT